MAKDIYTTGGIAEIFKVSTRAVTKWFDSGILKGFRIPGPCRGDRKIPKFRLAEFARENGLPLIFSEKDLDEDDILFSVKEAATICHLSKENIKDHVCSGSLAGYQLLWTTVPHILRDDLIKFMKRQRIPLEYLEEYELSQLSK